MKWPKRKADRVTMVGSENDLGAQMRKMMGSLNLHQQMRLAAALDTGGEMEWRVRAKKDGGPAVISIWLMATGDQGIKLVSNDGEPIGTEPAP